MPTPHLKIGTLKHVTTFVRICGHRRSFVVTHDPVAHRGPKPRKIFVWSKNYDYS